MKGFLIDIQGVLLQDTKAIEGAISSVQLLRDNNIPFRLLTNTTTRPLSAILENLQEAGFSVTEKDILSAPVAGKLWLKNEGIEKVYLVLEESVKVDFKDFTNTEKDPEVVLIGDIGTSWDYALLNRIFQMVINGSKLVALHKGKFWRKEGALQLDIGAFVKALEYSTGNEAVVIGKPSAQFFENAAKDMGMDLTDLTMIGDDIDSDVGGAQQHGIRGVLVRTGKYNEVYISQSEVSPNLTIDSIAHLSAFL